VIIVVTNRRLNEGASDEQLFGEKPNIEGLDELRVAEAIYDLASERWHLDLLEDDPATWQGDENNANVPSRQLFQKVMAEIAAGNLTHSWVFYIHGFDQSFEKALAASRDLVERYEVNVICFTWPSNPGGFVTNEYRRSQQAAKASANAIDRALEKLGRYLRDRCAAQFNQCRISINLLVHSQGNFLMESFVRDPVFSNETRLFDNIIFHQADVDRQTHTEWMDRVVVGKRIYVTINEGDSVLKASNLLNSDRLGSTLVGLTAQRAIYVDFTNANGVDRAHNLFLGVPDNDRVVAFFQGVLTGQRGERVAELEFDSRVNAFQF
jgi:esterase/lipase superfamily enzyme